jgi:hypothetical protein
LRALTSRRPSSARAAGVRRVLYVGRRAAGGGPAPPSPWATPTPPSPPPHAAAAPHPRLPPHKPAHTFTHERAHTHLRARAHARTYAHARTHTRTNAHTRARSRRCARARPSPTSGPTRSRSARPRRHAPAPPSLRLSVRPSVRPSVPHARATACSCGTREASCAAQLLPCAVLSVDADRAPRTYARGGGGRLASARSRSLARSHARPSCVLSREPARARACERARLCAQAVARTDCVLLSLRKADLDELLRGEQVAAVGPW